MGLSWNLLNSDEAKNFFKGKSKSYKAHAFVAELKKSLNKKREKYICHLVEFQGLSDLPRGYAEQGAKIFVVA